MKRYMIAALALSGALALAACGAQTAPAAEPAETNAPTAAAVMSYIAENAPPKQPEPSAPAETPDETQIICVYPPAPTEEQEMAVVWGFLPDPEEHTHALSKGGNVVEHEFAGYCGNTVTKLRRGSLALAAAFGTEDWDAAFMYDDSVTLTDLLLYLDYNGDVCRCLPEYTAATEFSDSCYEISLTEGYVRHDGGQVQLTAEQLETVRGIIERNLSEA